MVDFLGIGAQKAGTTWLFDKLRQHPNIWMPFMKETHYFDNVHLKPDRSGMSPRVARNARAWAGPLGWKRRFPFSRIWPERIAYFDRLADPDFADSDEWYRYIFSIAPAGATTGEITPLYSVIGRDGIAHVKRLLPDVRLIYLVRDPADRALSSMRMQAERSEIDLADPAAVTEFGREQMARPGFRARGDYAANIPLWDEAFADRVLYLPFGAIREQPATVMRQIETFLALPHFDGYRGLSTPSHTTSKSIAITAELREDFARETADQLPFLTERFPPDFVAKLR